MNTEIESAWPVGALAAVIALIALVRGHWSDTLVVALVVFLLGGFLFPPAGILIGACVVFYLVIVHGAELAGDVKALVTPSSGDTAASAAVATAQAQNPVTQATAGTQRPGRPF